MRTYYRKSRARASEVSVVGLACAVSVHISLWICATDVDASQLSLSLSHMMHKICTYYTCERLLSPIYVLRPLFFGISISFITARIVIELGMQAACVQAARFLRPGCASRVCYFCAPLIESITKQLNATHTAHEVCFHSAPICSAQFNFAIEHMRSRLKLMVGVLSAEFWFHLPANNNK
jgi:hypothetical protein